MTEQENPNDAAASGEEANQGRVFNQDEVNRIVAERLSRQSAQFNDYDQLKAQAAELATIKTAQLSDLERAQQEREAAESKAQTVMQSANKRITQAQFIAEAAKAGATHPEDAYALADKAGVSVAEDGTVQGAAEAVAALVAGGRLVMSGKPRAADLNGGAGGGDRPSDGAVKLTPEELDTAAKMGIPPDEYAKYKR